AAGGDLGADHPRHRAARIRRAVPGRLRPRAPVRGVRAPAAIAAGAAGALAMSDLPEIKPYRGPAGGWGALKSVTTHLLHQDIPVLGAKTLLHANQPD